MAKVSAIVKNNKRKKLIDNFYNKRLILKSKIYDKSLSIDERLALVMILSKFPKNSSYIRFKNRCALTGRPKGVYRKFMLSRIMIRDLVSQGMLPGLIKSSW